MKSKSLNNQFCRESSDRVHSKLLADENECWNWLGSIDKQSGYGSYGWKQYNSKIHRWMYEYFYAEKPGALHVCHHCDNKRCANPLHLYLGTAKDNAHDVRVRGRNYYTKLVACKNGHPFTKENTYRPQNKPHRYCRTCINMRGRRYYQEIKNDKTRYMRRAERIKNQRQANPRPYTLASYIYGFIRRLAIKDGYL